MRHKLIVIIKVAIGLLFLGYFIYFLFGNSEKINDSSVFVGTNAIIGEESYTFSADTNGGNIEYKNDRYGFTVTLPKDWDGFTVIEDEWEGYDLETQYNSQNISHKGPMFFIRHPDWEYKAPRQDLPIMVFSISKWNDLVSDKFHIGAAPVNPTELSRNKRYVFALPARYNYGYLSGHEQVEDIIKSGGVKGF